MRMFDWMTTILNVRNAKVSRHNARNREMEKKQAMIRQRQVMLWNKKKKKLCTAVVVVFKELFI